MAQIRTIDGLTSYFHVLERGAGSEYGILVIPGHAAILCFIGGRGRARRQEMKGLFKSEQYNRAVVEKHLLSHRLLRPTREDAAETKDEDDETEHDGSQNSNGMNESQDEE